MKELLHTCSCSNRGDFKRCALAHPKNKHEVTLIRCSRLPPMFYKNHNTDSDVNLSGAIAQPCLSLSFFFWCLLTEIFHVHILIWWWGLILSSYSPTAQCIIRTCVTQYVTKSAVSLEFKHLSLEGGGLSTVQCQDCWGRLWPEVSPLSQILCPLLAEK